MTISIGYHDAKLFTDAHETHGGHKPGVGQDMDFYNNAVGRNIAQGATYLTKCSEAVGISIHHAMREGRLRIIKRYSFAEQFSEAEARKRYLVHSNAWEKQWPQSYKILTTAKPLCGRLYL